MRPATSLAALVLIVAGFVAGCGGSSSEGTSSSPTHTPAGPAGASARSCSLDAGALRATGVGCGEAQRLALAWQRRSECGVAPGASHSACTVRGYRCIGTATARGLSVGCSRPGRSIAFTARRQRGRSD